MNNNYMPYQPQNSIIWVNGIEGAKSYFVPNGNSALLMDSNSQTFYIKEVDISGMPKPLRTFTYEEVVDQPQTNYVTKEELDKALAEIRRNRKPDKYNKEKD